jgi:glycine cleavage system T protein
VTDTTKPDPDTRHGPLEDLHRALGAKLGPFGGWLMPIEYRGVLSEHRAVRERVGLFDLSHLGKLDVVGASAFDALQGLLTNDLRKVDVGRAQYHHLLNERGGVEEDLFVYHLADDRWFLVPNAANKDKVVAAVGSWGAEVVDHDGWCFLGVQGPRSDAVVNKLWRTAVELSFREVRVVDWHGTEVVLARTGYTGERGFELFADAGIAPELWDAIVTAGRPFDLEACGLGARDVLRLEMGYPLYGQDLGSDDARGRVGVGSVVRQGPVRRPRRARPPARAGPAEPPPRPRDRRPAPHPAFAPAGDLRGAHRRGGDERDLLAAARSRDRARVPLAAGRVRAGPGRRDRHPRPRGTGDHRHDAVR